ncbi:hypothetical protein ABBQ32_012318 [Trebouxia sp. C0010 RCD-2024]
MSQFAQRASVTDLPACRCLHSRPVLLGRPARRLLISHNIPNRCEKRHSGLKRRQHQKQPSQATAGSISQTASVFPAGRTQARVKLPACILRIAATEVLQEQGLQEILSSATAGGITGVLLTDTSGSDGAALYEAACKLKEHLRGRAVLLIADRTDIVDAAEADGVILSSKGLPTVVARRMLQQGGLVGRVVASGSDAVSAAAEGADLVFLEGTEGDLPSSSEVQKAKQQRSKNAIPIIASIPADTDLLDASSLCSTDLDGIALTSAQLPSVAQSFASSTASSADAQVQAILSAILSSPQERKTPDQETSHSDNGHKKQGKQLLSAAKEDLVEAERQLLEQLLGLLQQATPEMQEMSMLTDALKQLDELFLLVVVGEFNSGKSSVINALLGSRYLAEGILPTTNEISVLKFLEDGEEEFTQNSDGFFIRRLPAKLLQEMNVVDTPGTNVILDRQQRLTEEYVPRADLVLFVMSADRPFTESEVNFLKYIRQWGKKVIFLVNKVDILSNDDEVQEVVQFVSDNAKRVLNVDTARVIPVSSRLALDAKLAVGDEAAGALQTSDNGQLQQDGRWDASHYGNLEQFIYDYLTGGASAGESVRLKLQTPLFVAEALAQAAHRQLTDELQTATQEAKAVAAVQSELETFQAEMQQASLSQRQVGQAAVDAAVQRAQRFVDRTLRLTNLSTLSAYVIGQGPLPVSRSFQGEILGDATRQLTDMVSEHSIWLRDNCDRQVRKYRSFADARMQQLASSASSVLHPQQPSQQASTSTPGSDASPNDRRQWRQNNSLLSSQDEAAVSQAVTLATKQQESALQVVNHFEVAGAAALLEEEIREALVGTAGTAAGAGAFGLVLTQVLQSTVEDLLAIGVASLAGYISVLGLPQKRAAAKEKLQRVAANFAKDVDGKMQQELDINVSQCMLDIQSVIAPIQQLTAAEQQRLETALSRLEELRLGIEDLKQKAANVE